MKNKLLLVEDDKKYIKMLENFLVKSGYDVVCASDGLQALEIFHKDPNFDLVILDVMMPDLDGSETREEIRYISDVPIIMLTALDDEENEINGLESGADDYISKSCSLEVIKTRIAAILRRKKVHEAELLKDDLVEVDLNRRTVTSSDKLIELSPREYKLLLFLMKNKNISLSRDQILESVWGFDYDGEWRNVDTHIKRLRKKLGKASKKIKTVYGLGYRWE